MEDMARLAIIEQNLKDGEKFNRVLYELLQYINQVLENPHDYDLRTIKSDVLKNLQQCEAFTEYLKYIGFEPVSGEFMYPKEQILSKLRMAQAAIGRKIYFCSGEINPYETKKKSSSKLQLNKKVKLTPANVLNTSNRFLLKIEALFNDVLKYEDEELLEEARQQIPLVTIQLKALDRIREHQKKIKSGEIKGPELSFDLMQLMELLHWFKYKFFTWVDKPPCESCGGATKYQNSSTIVTDTETCVLEVYVCVSCGGGARFARHTAARAVLRARRGRCGEWASCFTLLARTLGYDTRYVYDVTDHVWCEVFDFDSNRWLHVDPCECQLDAPLTYSHGWNKKLSYVIALSRDDLQDVTWRYTTDHKEVLKRRKLCDERELISAILTLREHRQRQVSEARRRYLARRTLQELVQLMVERKPSDYESHGRISGGVDWRIERGEIGTKKGHIFKFTQPGSYNVEYCTGRNKYLVTRDGEQVDTLDEWDAGVYDSHNMFRKFEMDWKMVYIARQEDTATGFISWKLTVPPEDLCFHSLNVKLRSALYEDGVIEWTVQFDNDEPISVKFGEKAVHIEQRFRDVTVTGRTRGGRGKEAWQHAQLFRQPAGDVTTAFQITAVVARARGKTR